MKNKSLKELEFKRETISNFQQTQTQKARSWGFSCFTGTRNDIE